LTSDPATDSRPIWSSDGQQLLFERGEVFDRDLWVMDADGSNQRDVTGMTGDETDAAWSSDGRSIAFAHRDPAVGLNHYEVFVVDVAGGAPRNLSNPSGVAHGGTAGAPAWSPDGREIA
jgi:TolB protein